MGKLPITRSIRDMDILSVRYLPPARLAALRLVLMAPCPAPVSAWPAAICPVNLPKASSRPPAVLSTMPVITSLVGLLAAVR
jgi:hypothetical protein